MKPRAWVKALDWNCTVISLTFPHELILELSGRVSEGPVYECGGEVPRPPSPPQILMVSGELVLPPAPPPNASADVKTVAALAAEPHRCRWQPSR